MRLALVLLVASFGTAAADDQPDDVPVRLAASLADHTATFTVRYSLAVEGPLYTTVRATLALPTHGLVTGATAWRDGAAHRLELLRASVASERFDALGGEGPPGLPPNAVMLSDVGDELQVAIASPRPGRIELEVEITAPTCWWRDARYVEVPADWRRALPASQRATTTNELIAACDASESAVFARFPVDDARRRPSAERVVAFASRLDAGTQHLVRFELDLAGTLADVPRDLATVIVVDGSRSLSVQERHAQQALVRAYLAAAGTTRVQVIAFARTAQPLLPTWMTATAAAGRVDRELAALAPRNGSNLDAGLAEAARWLRRIDGTRRIVLVTDERMSSRLQDTPAGDLKAAVPAGTLIHVAHVVDGVSPIARNDDLQLAPLAIATEGLSVDAGTGPQDATMLVRPTSVDRLTITPLGWTALPFGTGMCGDDDRIVEGDACTWWGTGASASGAIAIEGKVWNRRFVRVVRPLASRAIDVARELSARRALDGVLQARVDELARAVNEVWSLYAAWGGSGRYAIEPLGGLGMSGTGSGGSSASITDRLGTIGRIERIDLASQLAPVVAHCKVPGVSVDVQLEMTLLEVVDVAITGIHAPTATPDDVRRIETCVTEALWTSAPMLPDPRASSRHRFRFNW